MSSPTTMVVGAFVVFIFFPAIHCYPWGAPESTCDTGEIPFSHGTPSDSTTPFRTRLLTTYTDVEVSDQGWLSGLNYDIEVSTTDTFFYGIGGYLIHDITNNASLLSINPNISTFDHLGSAQMFTPLQQQLRCGGAGVTHFAAPNNRTVEALQSIRFTARAPDILSGNIWTFRLTLFTMPINEGSSIPYRFWPNEGNISTHPGQMFVFQSSFPRFSMNSSTAYPSVSCGPMSPHVDGCSLPGSSNQQCFADQSLRRCTLTNSDTAVVLSADQNGDIVLGGQDMLVRVSSDFLTVQATSFTATGHSRVLHVADAGNRLLSCGTGYGRPHCQWRNLSTLAPLNSGNGPFGDDGSGWFATGAIPRTSSAAYGMLVANGSLFSAHFQVPVPNDGGAAANVITRSLLTATDDGAWNYQYSEPVQTSGTLNNGLYRSTRIQPLAIPWLIQPGAAETTTFTTPWTKNADDPYVYVGVFQATGNAASQRQSYVARVCKNEASATDFNHFNSFLRMESSCTLPGSSSFSVDQITAAATNDNSSSSLVYMAYTSNAQDAAVGSAICIFSYTSEPYGIDFEMAGYINYGIASSPFSSVSGQPFSCMRSATDGRFLYAVSPDSQDPSSGREGQARSTRVAWMAAGANTSIAHLAVHTESYSTMPSVDVVWAVNTLGTLYKLAIHPTNTTAAATVVQTYALSSTPSSLVLDAGGSSVIVGTAAGAVRVPFAACARYQTCTACVRAADPYCGWCTTTRTCSAIGACANASTWLHQWIPDVPACPALLPRLSVAVLAVEARTVQAHLTLTAAPGSAPFTSTAAIHVGANDTRVAVPWGTVFPHTVQITGLVPHSTYVVAAYVTNDGGTLGSAGIPPVRTRQAAPTGLTAPIATPLNATAIRVSWSPPASPNGVVSGYSVLRNGTRICCSGDDGMATVDTGLDPYTLYAYSVAASTEGGQHTSAASEEAHTRTDGAVSAPPPRPTVTNITATSALVLWAPPVRPNGILLGYLVFLNGERVFLDEDAIVDVGAPSARVRGLRAYTTYNVTVRAVSAFGTSDASLASDFDTLPGIPSQLVPVTAGRVVNDTHSSAYITWDAPPDQFPVDGYVVYALTGGATRSLVYRGNGTEAVLRGVAPCTVLHLTAAAYTVSGTGDFSIATQLQTQAPRPPARPRSPFVASWAPANATLLVHASTCNVYRHVVRQTAIVDGAAPEWTEICCNGTVVANASSTSTVIADDLDEQLAYEFQYAEEFLNTDESVVRSPWSESARLEIRIPLTTTTTTSSTTTSMSSTTTSTTTRTSTTRTTSSTISTVTSTTSSITTTSGTSTTTSTSVSSTITTTTSTTTTSSTVTDTTVTSATSTTSSTTTSTTTTSTVTTITSITITTRTATSATITTTSSTTTTSTTTTSTVTSFTSSTRTTVSSVTSTVSSVTTSTRTATSGTLVSSTTSVTTSTTTVSTTTTSTTTTSTTTTSTTTTSTVTESVTQHCATVACTCPTPAPTVETESPTQPPTEVGVTWPPSNAPSNAPSDAPTITPTSTPTDAPSPLPSSPPTDVPSLYPTVAPSNGPTSHPSDTPSDAPTDAPSLSPTAPPSTTAPSLAPTVHPSTSRPSAAGTTAAPTCAEVNLSMVPCTIRPGTVGAADDQSQNATSSASTAVTAAAVLFAVLAAVALMALFVTLRRLKRLEGIDLSSPPYTGTMGRRTDPTLNPVEMAGAPVSIDNLGYLHVDGTPSRGSFIEGIEEANGDFITTIPRPKSVRDSILDDEDVTAARVSEMLNDRTSNNMLGTTVFSPSTSNTSLRRETHF
eukprot:m.1247026 g.1247026  ORF g.1247026 m.1247026 type:complete len:1791 (-) comp24689_c0_seq2:25-5397(-)